MPTDIPTIVGIFEYTPVDRNGNKKAAMLLAKRLWWTSMDVRERGFGGGGGI